MNRKSFISAFAILLIGLTSLNVNAYGKDKTLEDLKIYAGRNELGVQSSQNSSKQLDLQYAEAEKQLALSRMALDRLKFKRANASLEKQQQALMTEYQIQVEYYIISTYIMRLELVKDEATLADKQISAERERLYQGESIQLDVDEAIIKKQQIENKIADLTRSITEEQNGLKILLDNGKDNNYNVMDVSYEIPIKVTIEDTLKLEELISVCLENNLELLTIRNDITLYNTLIKSLLSCVGSDDSSYKNTVLERDKMQDDANAIVQKINVYVEKQYNTFRKSLAEYKANQELRAILVKRIEILKSTYVVGTISEIQYLSTRILLMEAINNIDFAVSDLINAKAIMDLIGNGII